MNQHHWQEVNGIVVPGHQVASGQAVDNPYLQGTITMQIPFFKALGLDLSHLFPATLNVSIHPHKFEIFNPEYTFKNLFWAVGYPAEDFSFSACQVTCDRSTYKAWIYYPHIETKIGHFQNPSVLEIIAPKIVGVKYNTPVTLKLNLQEILAKPN